MALMTINHGDSTFYWRVAGIVGLIILALMALARVLAWYVFRFGRSSGRPSGRRRTGMSQRRLGWEIAWKPVLMLMVMVYAIVCIPLGWMFWQQDRTIAALPVVTVDDTEYAGEYRRVEGRLASEPVYWAPRGTGRGGNNFSGAGVLVDLPSGGEALLLAESLSVPDFVGVMDDVGERRDQDPRQGDRRHHRGPGGVLRLRRELIPGSVRRRPGDAAAVVSVAGIDVIAVPTGWKNPG